jgi:hypothetical protein
MGYVIAFVLWQQQLLRPVRAPNQTLQHRLKVVVGTNTNGGAHFANLVTGG